MSSPISFDRRRPFAGTPVFRAVAAVSIVVLLALVAVQAGRPSAGALRSAPALAKHAVQSTPRIAIAQMPAANASFVPGQLELVKRTGELRVSDRVDGLVRTGSPEDAYAAYLILQRCTSARRRETEGKVQAPSAASICDDLAPSQLSLRTQLIEKAAAAGVAGAVWSFLRDGPNGSGRMATGTPDEMLDATVAEYIGKARTYQEAAARAGDRLALMGVSAYAENEERDLPKALVYWAAQERVAQAQGVPGSATYGAIVSELTTRMTASQAEAALLQGAQMAAAFKSVPCTSCGDLAEASPVQPAALEMLRRHVAEAPGATARSHAFEPSDTYTSCIGDRCQTLIYQAIGAWMPLPASN